jgi:protein-disulfide isomerase
VLWYGINLLQFGAAWLALDRGPLAAVGAAVGNLVRPMGLVAVGTFGAALVVGWLTYDALHDRWAARRPPMQAASEITALQIPPGAATKRAKKHAGSDVPAAVSIVEFSDFECPFCKGLWDILVDLIENTELDIQVTYVHFPLDSKCNPLLPREMHPNACAAARAAECAGKQGKFWEMGSKLFTNQAALEADRLVDYAAELGLDVGAFLACSSEPSVDALVRAHTAAGEKAQIEATPTLFINGRKLEGAPTRAELERTIRGILEEGTAADGAATATKPPKG